MMSRLYAGSWRPGSGLSLRHASGRDEAHVRPLHIALQAISALMEVLISVTCRLHSQGQKQAVSLIARSHQICLSCCRFNKINGVLIPGGSQDLSPGHPYFDSVALLLNLTKEANDKGDFFPVRFHKRSPHQHMQPL
jgi:hypothetical protein